MKFLIINTDYPQFINWFYTKNPELKIAPFERQMQSRMESLFGMADFYSSNLIKLGHDAHELIPNNEYMQKAWAAEHIANFEVSSSTKSAWRKTQKIKNCTFYMQRRLSRYLPFSIQGFGLDPDSSWFYKILRAQIEYYEPDVVLNHAIIEISSKFLKTIKSKINLLVGQHAATQLSKSRDWNSYDLLLSSFPPTLEWFRKQGIPAELLRLGFEPHILSKIKNDDKVFDIAFVGSLFSVHSSRIPLLEQLCDEFKGMKIWGPDISHLLCNSSIRRCYLGEAWGLDMFQILRNSKIALNHHGDVLPFSNNMRLFEATGVGTMLLTDWKENLHEMFEPGKELVPYHNIEECIELIKYYLNNEKERETIASAGQERTLKEHSYLSRMQDFLDIIKNYM